MSMQKRANILFRRTGWWATLLAGVAIGILSQHIPEVQSYTDGYVEPIKSSSLFQKVKQTIGSNRDKGEILGTDLAYSHYTQDPSPSGTPVSSFIINRNSYSLAYDARTRNPLWVYEHLTADNLKGDAARPSHRFKEDENIPQHLRTNPADYKGQGLDQGHMASAGDHTTTPTAIDETFYLTNICPQCPQFNRVFWAKLEKHARDLTLQYPHVYVISGPLYLPYQEGKRRFVKYQVIGPNEVAVPSHFFKVLMLENRDGQREAIAYVLPNAAIPHETPLEQFRTTTQKVEKAAGMLLFNQNDDKKNYSH